MPFGVLSACFCRSNDVGVCALYIRALKIRGNGIRAFEIGADNRYRSDGNVVWRPGSLADCSLRPFRWCLEGFLFSSLVPSSALLPTCNIFESHLER